MSDTAVVDDDETLQAPPQGIDALRSMRRARRRRRLGNQEWFDVAYRVYLTALFVGFAVLFAVGAVGDGPLDAADRATLLARAPSVVGLLAALGLAAGLRSGSRGGPLALQPPDVRHILLAPLDRRAVLRPLALRQLRYSAFVALLLGTTMGLLLHRRMEGSRVEWAAWCAAAAVAVVVLAVGSALVASGIGLPRPVATAAALALITGAVLDVGRVIPWTTTAFGSLALWPADTAPEGLVAAGVAVVLAVVGLALAHRVRVEDAERRTLLAGQLKFAVTTRDLRTVVVLHRLLAQDRPRLRPWFKVPARPADPAWRRSWHSVARFPLPRLARIAGLGAVAGLALGGMYRGSTPLALVAALALMVAALDLLEPLAQARDHVDGTNLLPFERTILYTRLMIVPGLLTLVVAGFGVAAVAPFATGTELAVAAIALPAAALAGLGGAAIVLVREERADLLDGQILPPEVAGMRELLKTVIPVAVAVSGCLPIVTARIARREGEAPAFRTVQGAIWPLVVTGLVVAWVHRRDAIAEWQRRSMAEAKSNAGLKAGTTP